jgi:hypothetical protein
MIDGVDVSECEYFSKYLWGDDNIYQNIINKEKVTPEELVGTHLEGYSIGSVKKNICTASNCCCSDKSNCIFKQLKRNEQECKELQQKLDITIKGLKNIIKANLPCPGALADDCLNCTDEITDNGKDCMLGIAYATLKRIENN